MYFLGAASHRGLRKEEEKAKGAEAYAAVSAGLLLFLYGTYKRTGSNKG